MLIGIGIDSSEFKVTNASHYYTDKTKLRNEYLKLSLNAFSVIPVRCEHVPIFRTHGKYRKQTCRLDV